MLIHAINESFHTCFVIFSFPLWLISFGASCWSCLILLASYTFSSSPHCSSLLFLHHFLRGQYRSICFHVFLKKFTELFFYAQIYLSFICLSIIIKISTAASIPLYFHSSPSFCASFLPPCFLPSSHYIYLPHYLLFFLILT